MHKNITVEVTINKPIATVWKFWTAPKQIVNWNFASDDWECPRAINDLKVGGHFSYIMAAKDKSASFDFNGEYTAVDYCKLLAYTIQGGREVTVKFEETPTGTRLIETFEMETTNSEEKQRSGWQSILNNFKKLVEASK